MIVKVLRGTKVADLPVEQPTVSRTPITNIAALVGSQ
jgi:hypothetical protein